MTWKIKLDSFLANTLWKRPHKHYGFQKRKKRQLVLGLQTTIFWHITPSFIKKQELVLKHIYQLWTYILSINCTKNKSLIKSFVGSWEENGLKPNYTHLIVCESLTLICPFKNSINTYSNSEGNHKITTKNYKWQFKKQSIEGIHPHRKQKSLPQAKS